MSVRELFDLEEWNSIVAAPAMAGVAVAAASPSGPFGLMKEIMSVSLAVHEIIERGSDNPIISTLIDDFKHGRTRPEGPSGLRSSSPETAKQLSLQHLRKVSEMLYRKDLSDAHVEEFKRWLVSIAERVAEAAAEGGFLGIGGVRISEEERAIIRQLAFALGLPATTP
jgi:hypothetical protein